MFPAVETAGVIHCTTWEWCACRVGCKTITRLVGWVSVGGGQLIIREWSAGCERMEDREHTGGRGFLSWLAGQRLVQLKVSCYAYVWEVHLFALVLLEDHRVFAGVTYVWLLTTGYIPLQNNSKFSFAFAVTKVCEQIWDEHHCKQFLSQTYWPGDTTLTKWSVPPEQEVTIFDLGSFPRACATSLLDWRYSSALLHTNQCRLASACFAL